MRDDVIPNGWKRVRTGKTGQGDKYWDNPKQAWLPVTGDNAYRSVLEFTAVIRKSPRTGAGICLY